MFLPSFSSDAKFENAFVKAKTFTQSCSLTDDIESSPVLLFLSKLIAITLAFLTVCLLFTCCRYRNLSHKYEIIASSPAITQQVEIVSKNSDKPDTSGMRKRQTVPDPDTFGTVSEEDRATNAEKELEMSDLNIEFA